ncbi:MAG: aminotransferase class III-fold pyridoxal phosphate-dependent enzyme [candidate division NC10 bacterium]|nr:aminotransferase class III-fold pyridoxal phosphate-dependent enzyme [candidate division NC10 bacterium]
MTTRHNLYTWTAQRGYEPFPLAGGEGAWFRDTGGRRYLDLASVVFNANAGHNHPRILDSMRRQLDDLAVAGPWMTTEVRERAASELAQVTPKGLDRFLFTLGGADANEHAVKIAMLATGRSKVVCRVNAYHGATIVRIRLTTGSYTSSARINSPGRRWYLL